MTLTNDPELEKIANAISEAEENQETDWTKESVTLAGQEDLEAQIAEDMAIESAFAEPRKHNGFDAEAPEAEQETAAFDLAEAQACVEALLFMSEKPISEKKLRELIESSVSQGISSGIFAEAMAALKERYSQTHHGVEIVEVAGGLQLRTKPGKAFLATKLAKVQTQKLSHGALETLAIVAYKQPIMKDQIDKIRGVDSSYFVHGLLNKNLIKIVGRSELPGRPMLYATTDQFLEVFGLRDLSSLPPLNEMEQMVPASQSANPSEEKKISDLRMLVGRMNTDAANSIHYDPKDDEQFLKEIKQRIVSIPTSTPFINMQKELERSDGAGTTTENIS